jgi:hypothetical protein
LTVDKKIPDPETQFHLHGYYLPVWPGRHFSAYPEIHFSFDRFFQFELKDKEWVFQRRLKNGAIVPEIPGTKNARRHIEIHASAEDERTFGRCKYFVKFLRLTPLF